MCDHVRSDASRRTPRTDPLAFLDDEVAALARAPSLPRAAGHERAQGPIVSVDERRLISLSSNDYLGLTHHPRLREAALAAVREFGVGSGAVRTIAGTMSMHEALEAELAEFKGTPAVLTFQSGFTANTGVIPTITGETDLIVCDEPQPRLDHRRDAPLEGAAQGLSRTPTSRRSERSSTRRSSTVATGAASLPADPRRHRRRLLDGRRHRAAARASSRPPRPTARRSSSTMPMPRACSGATGAARVDHFGLHGRVAIQVGTLSKAVGALGGYVAGSMALREILTQRARPFLFSTSHPPAVVAACREAIKVMQDEPGCSSGCGPTPGGSRRSWRGSGSTRVAPRRRSRR